MIIYSELMLPALTEVSQAFYGELFDAGHGCGGVWADVRTADMIAQVWGKSSLQGLERGDCRVLMLGMLTEWRICRGTVAQDRPGAGRRSKGGCLGGSEWIPGGIVVPIRGAACAQLPWGVRCRPCR